MEDKRRLLQVLLATVFFTIPLVNAQTECLDTQTSFCGTFCCPTFSNTFDSEGNPRTECCITGAPRVGCCSVQENTVAICSGTSCPDYLTEGKARDGSGNLRNECCSYFRTGCCSSAENNNLNILFQLAIGLTIGIVGLIIIIVLLIVCCCYCGICA